MTKIIVELNEKAHRKLVLAKSINHDKNYVQTLNRILESLEMPESTSASILDNFATEMSEIIRGDLRSAEILPKHPYLKQSVILALSDLIIQKLESDI